jgi:hypothetical protein
MRRKQNSDAERKTHRCNKQNTNAHSCCCCFLAFTLLWYALASVDPADTAPASILLALLKFPTANPSRISSPWSVSLTSEPFYTSSQNPAKSPPTFPPPPPSHPLRPPSLSSSGLPLPQGLNLNYDISSTGPATTLL